MANCPNCGAPLEGAGTSCKYCGWQKEGSPVNNQTVTNSVTSDISGPTKFCSTCGAKISENAEICPKCGVRQETSSSVSKKNVSDKSRKTCLLLCIFLGGLGIHRFYTDKVGTGILLVILNLCFGIGLLWYIFDIIMIASGSFKDKYGKVLANW